jgi:hypothetical protein
MFFFCEQRERDWFFLFALSIIFFLFFKTFCLPSCFLHNHKKELSLGANWTNLCPVLCCRSNTRFTLAQKRDDGIITNRQHVSPAVIYVRWEIRQIFASTLCTSIRQSSRMPFCATNNVQQHNFPPLNTLSFLARKRRARTRHKTRVASARTDDELTKRAC